jgi:hypothetical protein
LRVSIKNPDVDIDKIAKENLSRLATIIKWGKTNEWI